VSLSQQPTAINETKTSVGGKKAKKTRQTKHKKYKKSKKVTRKKKSKKFDSSAQAQAQV